MGRLGYERYGVQGGDEGAFLGPEMGRVDPAHVVGVHVNALVQIPSPRRSCSGWWSSRTAEREAVARFKHFRDDMMGYVQSNRRGPTPSPTG